jgi:hypothetical protein
MEEFKIKDLGVLKALLHNSIQTNVILLAQTDLMLKLFSSSQEDFDKNQDFYLDAAKTASGQIREQLFVLFGDLDLKDLLDEE